MQRELGSENGYLDMKYIVLAAVTAFAVGTAVTAHAENQPSPDSAVQPAYSGTESNVAALTALFAKWDRAGFNAPANQASTGSMGGTGM